MQMKKEHKTDYKHKSKKAYTLSEVLVVLVVIGIVAALAIPRLVQQTERRELASRLDKAYSLLTQQIKRMSLKSGFPPGDYSFIETNDFLDSFAENSHIMKKCDTAQACFGSSFDSNSKYLTLNVRPISAFQTGKAMIANDGIIYTYTRTNPETEVYGITEDDKNHLIGQIIVDVNGHHTPNRFGLDTYIFYLVDGKGIIPAGLNRSSDCNRGGKGYTCAARVLKDHRIKY